MALSGTVLTELARILGADGVFTSREARLTYEADMHTLYKGEPDAVVLPRSTEQVRDVVRLCRRERIPIVPRGSGTGLIGGAMAPRGGVMVSMTRMTEMLEIDLANRSATVQPGVINLWLTDAVRDRGYFFAPDPSSQMVSSIGGNVSTNAGGPHCLKYGITTNHVLGLEFVTGAGDVLRVGGKAADRPGYDLPGAMVGAINAAVGKVYPDGAGAVLLIELDGPRAEVEAQGERIAAIGRQRQALFVTVARDELERALLWKGRKEAAGAIGRIASAYLLQDAVVPRSKLPQIMKEMIALGRRYNVVIANVFHAGDGNLHPMICYDDRNADEFARAQEANEALLRACIALGGSVTGEHGVGMDKAKNLPLQYADADLNFMYRLRRVFDPDGLMNPAKLLPSHPACGEGFRPTRPTLPDGAWV